MNLSEAIHLLGDILGDTIQEQESSAAFEIEERIRTLAKAGRSGDTTAGPKLASEMGALGLDEARIVATAFTIYFDLVNLAEEGARLARLRSRLRDPARRPRSDSIESAMARLAERGVTATELAAALGELQVELVLTAHPTEAKRRSVLGKLERAGNALRRLWRQNPLPHERQDLMDQLRAEIAALWLTRRARTTRPTVVDEIRTNLYFLGRVLWRAAPRVDAQLRRALDRHYPGLRPPDGWLRFASWVGGDRDGNPNVTTHVTAEALRLHRGLAVERHRAALGDLSRRLSLDARRTPPSSELVAWLETRRPFPAHVEFLAQRYPDEPYRQVFALLAADLADASREDIAHEVLDQTSPQRLLDLAAVREPTRHAVSTLPLRVRRGRIAEVVCQLDTFGLQAAALDMREDASQLRAALAETLRALGHAPDFESWDDSQRAALLTTLIEEDPPALAAPGAVTPRGADTWSLFRLIHRTRATLGREALGPFVISMAKGPADVLTVLLMARWTGCDEGLPIVPLFETLADLEAAPTVMESLFRLPAYRAHLAGCSGRQMVMIGYSDSNKDGGYASATWALYRAQENVARVGAAHRIRIDFFHGRGGTVARGGGPIHRAILAQPSGTVGARLRVTEQGENVASRYGDLDLADRHLEQVVSAVLLASFPESPPGEAVNAHWLDAMERVSQAAQQSYRGLVHDTPGFLDFWRAATPIEEIGRLRLGSRPALRRGTTLRVTDVRAIPWVFSWMQSRFNLPGWYGLGTGLETLLGSPSTAHGDELREMYRTWPFFKNLLDNAQMSLLKADLDIAALYVALVPDAGLGASIFERIRDEFRRTQETILRVTGHPRLLNHQPVIERSVRLRNPYVDPLNYLQVEILRRLRRLSEPEASEATGLREIVALTINGIAAGLRNTG